jgi:hypothetical protein
VETMRAAAADDGSGELERVRARRAAAERSAAERHQRLEGSRRGAVRGARGGADPDAAERALEAQTGERAAQLAAREEHLVARAARRSSTVDSQSLVRFTAINDELERRRATRTRAAVIERPVYLIRALGPYPRRPSERSAWRRAANGIETYRNDFGVCDEQQALGSEPGDSRQRAIWRDVRHQADRVRTPLAHALVRSPGRELR